MNQMPKPTPAIYGTRKPEGQSKFRPLTARAPEEFHDALADFAKRTGRDKSEILRAAAAKEIGFGVGQPLPGKRAA